ncbi:MAG: hypothetical protein WD065_01570 [Planctomycetaceae bacterium]
MKTPQTIFLVIVLVTTLALGGWFFRGQISNSQIAFDGTAWQRADAIDRYRTVRSQMIDDLLRHFNFEGWRRQQVVELPGEPTPGEPANMGFGQWDIVYIMGLERAGAYSLDQEALGFRFDGDDRVVSYGVSVN